MRTGWAAVVLLTCGGLAPRPASATPRAVEGGAYFGVTVVPVLVTVGKHGTVTWIRPGVLDGPAADARVWEAIRSGLERYRFRPATSPDGPVADWAVLRVRGLPGR